MYYIRRVSCIILLSLHLTNARVYSCANFMTASPPERDSGCCGYESGIGTKIIGGDVTAIYKYPWLVTFEYIKSKETIQRRIGCSGSLISGKFILTAAHCIESSDKDEVVTNVWLGVYNLATQKPVCRKTPGGGTTCTDPVIVIPIEKTIIHPDFNLTSLFNNIGLIKLSTAAPYTDYIRLICLPPKDYTEDPPRRFHLYVAGWGIYSQPEKNSATWSFSHVKRHVVVPLVNNEVCEEQLKSSNQLKSEKLLSSQMCAGNTNKTACIGDSGGPLMYEEDRVHDIIGIVSYGRAICGALNDPAVYTNVYHHLPWITNVTATEALHS